MKELGARTKASIIIIFFAVLYGVFYFFSNYQPIRVCDSSKPNTHYQIPTIPPYHWNGSGLVTIWFDDTWLSQYKVGLLLMQKYGYVGAIAIPTSFVCRPGYMTWDNIRKFQALGWETTSHAIHHQCDMNFYTANSLENELLGSKKIITTKGLRANQFVIPCGIGYSQGGLTTADVYERLVVIAKNNYTSVRTADATILNPLPLRDAYYIRAYVLRNTTTRDDILSFINAAATNKEWFVLVVHQIDKSKSPFAVTPKFFEEILSLIKESGLPVVLPEQVVKIKKAS